MHPITYEFLSTGMNRYGNYIYQDLFDKTLSNIYHSHDFYEIVLVCKGRCTHTINSTVYAHKPDEIIFLRPGDYHSFLSQSEDLRVLSLSVEKNEFEKLCEAYDMRIINLIKNINIPPIVCVPGTFSGIISHLNVYDEYDCKFVLLYLLKAFICSLNREKYKSPRSLENALREMQRPENLKEGVPALVRASGYSRPQLSRLIKKHRGVTPHEFVLTARLDRAYQSLILSDFPIDEIAWQVGFSSVSHFYKAFKTRFGITPYSLRKKVQETQDTKIF